MSESRISLEDFREWAAENRVNLVSERGGFKVGDVVVFTNEYSVSFSGNTILGFDADAEDSDRCVFLDNSSYWYANKLSEISF